MRCPTQLSYNTSGEPKPFHGPTRLWGVPQQRTIPAVAPLYYGYFLHSTPEYPGQHASRASPASKTLENFRKLKFSMQTRGEYGRWIALRCPARLTYPPQPRLLDVLQSAGRAQADRRCRIVVRYLHLISSQSVHCRGPLFGPQKNNGVPRPAALRRWGGAERRYAQARSLSTSEPHGSPSLPYLSHKRYATTPRKKPLRPPRSR